MVLTGILLLLLGLLIYFLLMPMELQIDSYQERYWLRLGFLAKASLEKDPGEILRLHLRVLFLNFYWRPSDLTSRKKGKKPAKKAKGRDHRRLSFRWDQGRRLLKTFRVKAFRLELDTGDPVMNARLYPFFFLLGQRAGDMRINFQDHNQVLLKVVNRPIYILNALINLKK
jgi:hypothetical protein